MTRAEFAARSGPPAAGRLFRGALLGIALVALAVSGASFALGRASGSSAVAGVLVALVAAALSVGTGHSLEPWEPDG